MIIKVFGPGCAKCTAAEAVVREAVAAAGVTAEIVKITDFQEMAAQGIFSTPAVAVDGVVKAMGRAPSKAEMMQWLS